MKQYKALFSRFAEQPIEDVFAEQRRAEGNDWEAPFKQIASMAKEEPWNFRTDRFKRVNQNYYILMNYLNYTFLRLQEQGKIAYSADQTKACINTGLQTDDERDLYATFFLNTHALEFKAAEWTLFNFAAEDSPVVAWCKPLPEVATYITDASDLVFDLSYDIKVEIEHIVDDHPERLPDALRGDRERAVTSIEHAVTRLKPRVLRNYRMAVPQWYEEHIQLLLPLNLTSDTEADLAAVLEKDPKRRQYVIRTALTMDMAYVNARRICRLDRDWLNP